MRKFVEVGGVSNEEGIPSEALKLGGKYIEDVIEGYKTLYVRGREEVSIGIQTVELINVDGEEFLNSKVESKEISIGFELRTSSSVEFREKFRILNSMLVGGEKEKRLEFNDELGYFYKGHFEGISGIEEGRLNVKGEISFRCLDPYAYSTRLLKGSVLQTSSIGLKIEKVVINPNKGTLSNKPVRTYRITEGEDEESVELDFMVNAREDNIPTGIAENIELSLEKQEVEVLSKVEVNGKDLYVDMIGSQTTGNDYDKIKFFPNKSPYIGKMEVSVEGDVGDVIELWAREVRV